MVERDKLTRWQSLHLMIVNGGKVNVEVASDGCVWFVLVPFFDVSSLVFFPEGMARGISFGN